VGVYNKPGPCVFYGLTQYGSSHQFARSLRLRTGCRLGFVVQAWFRELSDGCRLGFVSCVMGAGLDFVS
jgi:hypothetical protein